jgi:glycosidase
MASTGEKGPFVKAGVINAMALIDEILHAVCAQYRQNVRADAFDQALLGVKDAIGAEASMDSLLSFTKDFPPSSVYAEEESAESWLDGLADGRGKKAISLEELLLQRLANENPAFHPYSFLFDYSELRTKAPIDATLDAAEAALAGLPPFGPDGVDLPSLLRAPMLASPHSLAGQLAYMKRHWGLLIGDKLSKLLGGADMLAEEERAVFPPGPGPIHVPSYGSLDVEYEGFSEDKDWMPRVVMIAKSTLVWLDQLSKRYGRDIHTLDAIPEEELDILASRGFNALWLIGIWERSQASRRIKELCGNPEAAASAYSLFDYEIAWELGGWSALETLRAKTQARGIRLAADMVPNHTGLDSSWMRDRPELFIRRSTPPFPSYSYSGENLSEDRRFGLWLEDHYYDRKDAAVTFKRVDFRTGECSYVYHGNDGTSMPWNDTAQIDFLNPAAREAVKERILHVARNFPIIRFDAAMILAKRSFRRLWYPEPGAGGAIASRFESAMNIDAFNEAIPAEFWREVVDMCASEAPETLLLAEAFWMMEGYFVRTLGMHRVYNSAFMNMLKNKQNAEYRQTIKNTLEFDKDILKRFVNFMNNPDEDTAVAQFGKDDHYFGVCSLMATMPGLPMFGHGQIEGFTEKYGMEYRKAYHDEQADQAFVGRHEHEIVPLLKRRYLFSGVDQFFLYDLYKNDGSVDENVFAYSNGYGTERALVLFNNAWERSAGTIHRSSPFAEKSQAGSQYGVTRTLAEGLGLKRGKGRFMLATEMKSGLCFIRRTDTIFKHGLSVALNGFQCQVFTTIYEIEDDKSGSYSALCDSLSGSGVRDIGWALQDHNLAELYAAWDGAFGQAHFKREKTDVTSAQSLDKTGIISFIKTAMRFVGLKKETMALPTAQRLETMADACLAAAEMVQTLLAQDRAGMTTDKKARGVTKHSLSDRINATPMAAEALQALVALLPIAYLSGFLADTSETSAEARALADSWGMARKTREALMLAGSSWDVAELASSLAVALLGRLYTMTGPDRLKNIDTQDVATMTTIVDLVAGDDEARNCLGVNLWEGTTWFSAERYRLISTVIAANIIMLGVAKEGAVLTKLAAFDEAALATGWSLDAMATPAGMAGLASKAKKPSAKDTKKGTKEQEQ